jgi:hypothetical protein
MEQRYKFPRIPHLPWSPGATDDDIRVLDASVFEPLHLVITEKLDGENTTVYSDGYLHARSIDSGSLPWQSWVRGFLLGIVSGLPKGWRICGENMFAIHSIEYERLTDYFYVISIIDEMDLVLPWMDTLELCTILGLHAVPVIKYDVPFSQGAIEEAVNSVPPMLGTIREGYVVRDVEAFPYEHYDAHVAKYVRENHVQTDEHWAKHWRAAKLL